MITTQLKEKLFASALHTVVIMSVIVAAFVLYYVRASILLIFAALILAAALQPTVARLYKKWKIPKQLTAFALLTIVMTVFVLAIAWATPPLIEQTYHLFETAEEYITLPTPDLDSFFSQDIVTIAQSGAGIGEVTTQFSNLIFGVLSITNTIVLWLILLLSLLFLTFYIVTSPEDVGNSFAWLLPGSNQEKKMRAQQMFLLVLSELGHWVRGRVIVMFIIGVVTYVSLRLMGIPYALPLAVAATFLEIIPNIGPILAAIPAVLVAFLFVNPVMGGIVAIFYTALQQIESFIITPQVMKKSSEIHPLTTVILIIVGYELLGATGSLLSLPLFVTVRAIMSEFSAYRKEDLE